MLLKKGADVIAKHAESVSGYMNGRIEIMSLRYLNR